MKYIEEFISNFIDDMGKPYTLYALGWISQGIPVATLSGFVDREKLTNSIENVMIKYHHKIKYGWKYICLIKRYA